MNQPNDASDGTKIDQHQAGQIVPKANDSSRRHECRANGKKCERQPSIRSGKGLKHKDLAFERHQRVGSCLATLGLSCGCNMLPGACEVQAEQPTHSPTPSGSDPCQVARRIISRWKSDSFVPTR